MTDDVLGTGRTADVTEAGHGRVRRTYRDETDAAPEAALMRILAHDGYPVPEVYAADGPAMVLERLEPDSLAVRIFDGRVSAYEAGAIVGAALRRLHDVRIDAEETPASLERADAWPDAGADVYLHLDLHPDNVLFRGEAWQVIDWQNAAVGPAGLDVATSLLIVRASDEVAGAGREVGDAFEAGLIDAYGEDPAPWIGAGIERRLRDPNLRASERERLTRIRDGEED